MRCPVCASRSTALLSASYPGYVERTSYSIWECEACGTRFVDPLRNPARLYNIIYSNAELPGYDRYFRAAKEVLEHDDPLRFLSRIEGGYYAVWKYLQGKHGLKILEVGSGQGYLTYAMRKAGHDAFGIDISKGAVDAAKKRYGDFFAIGRIGSVKGKYDLIVATELIEHLEDPAGFIAAAMRVLKKGGVIILTTPNKDFAPDRLWATDAPPVHLTWLGKRSFEAMAKQHGWNVSFYPMNSYDAKTENRLVTKWIFAQSAKPAPLLTKQGKLRPALRERSRSPLRRMLRWLLIDFAPVRMTCNLLPRAEHHSLAVLIRAK